MIPLTFFFVRLITIRLFFNIDSGRCTHGFFSFRSLPKINMASTNVWVVRALILAYLQWSTRVLIHQLISRSAFFTPFRKRKSYLCLLVFPCSFFNLAASKLKKINKLLNLSWNKSWWLNFLIHCTCYSLHPSEKIQLGPHHRRLVRATKPIPWYYWSVGQVFARKGCMLVYLSLSLCLWKKTRWNLHSHDINLSLY
jgi:hypothetical protein